MEIFLNLAVPVDTFSTKNCDLAKKQQDWESICDVFVYHIKSSAGAKWNVLILNIVSFNLYFQRLST